MASEPLCTIVSAAPSSQPFHPPSQINGIMSAVGLLKHPVRGDYIRANGSS